MNRSLLCTRACFYLMFFSSLCQNQQSLLFGKIDQKTFFTLMEKLTSVLWDKWTRKAYLGFSENCLIEMFFIPFLEKCTYFLKTILINSTFKYLNIQAYFFPTFFNTSIKFLGRMGYFIAFLLISFHSILFPYKKNKMSGKSPLKVPRRLRYIIFHFREEFWKSLHFVDPFTVRGYLIGSGYWTEYCSVQ